MIKGGITNSQEGVTLTLPMRGGKTYNRAYSNDVVTIAIDKFVILSSMLMKSVKKRTKDDDIKFFITQVKYLLHRAPLELLPINTPFQIKYNLCILDGYIRMVLESNDIKLISQLLDLDTILFSLESASRDIDEPLFIDFDVDNVKFIKITDIEEESDISSPINEDVSSYVHSLVHNLIVLSSVIIANKKNLQQVYKNILTLASKHLDDSS
jgi:hypothetical protein